MSDVSNVMICIGELEEPDRAEELFSWIEHEMPLKNEAIGPDRRRPYAARPLLISGYDSPWGGVKAPEARIYAAALNYAVVMSIVEKCAAISWLDPEAFQLFIKDQHDARFRAWQFEGELLIELSP